MISKKFINNGFLHIKNDKTFAHQCTELNKLIKKNLTVNSRIFLTRKRSLKNKKKSQKWTADILSKINIDFVLNNIKIKKTLEKILEKNYKLVGKKIICGVPKKYLPKYITKKENIISINLGHYIKKKYRVVRYFNGIDFHQDQMDYSSTKCNVVTLYVYLDKVTEKSSPLIILPKSQKLGPDLFPHYLEKEKNRILYKTRKNKKIYTKEHKLVGLPGESWAWHSCMLHGTRANISKESRISLRLMFKKSRMQKNTSVDIINNSFDNKSGYKITSEFLFKKYNDVNKKTKYSTKK